MRKVKRTLKRWGLRRDRLAAARMCCERNLLASFAPVRQLKRARILCYHSVGTSAWGINDVSPQRFRRHIELALEIGYRFVPAERIASAGGAAGELAITFDDGLKTVVTNAAPILAEHGIPWTFFVVSDWADGRHGFGDDLMVSWDDVVSAAQAGASIGSHSVTHPNFGRLDAEVTARELFDSREVIEARTGIVPTSFAIPFGQSNNWSPSATSLAQQAGYHTIYSQCEEHRPTGTVPRTFVTTFDNDRIFRAVLAGGCDQWEEWV